MPFTYLKIHQYFVSPLYFGPRALHTTFPTSQGIVICQSSGEIQLTSAKRHADKRIPASGTNNSGGRFFPVCGSAVVKNNPQFLITSKSCERQRKAAYFFGNRLLSGAAGRIRTADLILTNRNLKLFMIFSVSLCSFLFRFICFPALFKSVVSAYSTQVCGCLCGQKAFLPKTLGYRESLFLFTVHLCRRELALSFCE